MSPLRRSRWPGSEPIRTQETAVSLYQFLAPQIPRESWRIPCWLSCQLRRRKRWMIYSQVLKSWGTVRFLAWRAISGLSMSSVQYVNSSAHSTYCSKGHLQFVIIGSAVGHVLVTCPRVSTIGIYIPSYNQNADWRYCPLQCFFPRRLQTQEILGWSHPI